jgi:tetratricopeptide (TPR) repeat protein
VAASPLFGHGAGSLTITAPEFLHRVLPTLPESWLPGLPHDLADHVHNEFMQAAVNGGIPSAILLALIWLAALLLVFRSMRTLSLAQHQFMRTIGASLVALFVCSFGSAPLCTTPTAVLFWALLGLLAGASQDYSSHLSQSVRSKWRLPIAVVACCVCAVTLSWQLSLVSANRLAKRAEDYVGRGLYIDAVQDYKRVLALWPWNYETRIKSAAVLAQTGQLAIALTAVEESTNWGASPEGWLLQSELLIALNRNSAAEAVLRKAIDVIPDLMRARLALANLQHRAGQREAALQQYRLVIASPQQSSLAMQLKKQAVDNLVAIAQETMPGAP